MLHKYDQAKICRKFVSLDLGIFHTRLMSYLTLSNLSPTIILNYRVECVENFTAKKLNFEETVVSLPFAHFVLCLLF